MNGFFNINKPKGMTSSQVVGKVKFLLGKKAKVGHMGTLDPLASGVLPIAVGRATRLFDFLLQKKKTYIATFQFGIHTDTLDSTGTTLDTSNVIPTIDQITSVLPQFLGVNQQIPPAYSAKSINGKRAYDLARQGQEVELKPCTIQIFDIQVQRQLAHDTFQFLITCSAGTYIRSIARDLGTALGTFATMTELIRTQSGQFQIQDAIFLDDFDAAQLLPVDFVLTSLPRLDITEQQLQTLLNGKKFTITGVDNALYTIYCDNSIQCLCQFTDGVAKPTVWLR